MSGTDRDAAREERGEHPSDDDSERRASEVERLERHRRPSGDDAGLHSDVESPDAVAEDDEPGP